MSLMLDAARSILTEAQAAEILKEAPPATLAKAFDNLRAIIGAPVPVVVGGEEVAAPQPQAVDELLAREEIVRAAFDGEYTKRSVGALVKLSGLTEDEVLAFVEDSDDLFTQRGRRTGKTYVLLHDGSDLSAEQIATIKRAFTDGTWSQRSIRALANLAGVSEAAILAFLEGNEEFVVSEGRRTGRSLVEFVGRPESSECDDDEPEYDDYDDEDDYDDDDEDDEWLD